MTPLRRTVDPVLDRPPENFSTNYRWGMRHGFMPVRLRRAVLVLLAVVALASASCTAGDPTEGAEDVGAPDLPVASTVTSPSDTADPADGRAQIPAGSYYLPSALPEGWELVALRFFDRGHEFLADPDSALHIVRPAGEGYGRGGARLTVTRAGTGGDVIEQPAGLGPLPPEPVEIAGWADAAVQYDESAGMGAVTGRVDDLTAISLLGDLPPDALVEIAAGVRVGAGSGSAIAVDLDLDGWVIEPGGRPGEYYLLEFRGPDGLLSVSVTPGVTEALLHVGSTDLERALEGTVGTGYYSVQRVEAENLEFPPRITWWVPDALLDATADQDPDLIVEILAGFIEVDEVRFRAAVENVTVEVIPVDDEPAPDENPDEAPDGPSRAGDQIDPERLAELIDFVEDRLGREFDDPPTVEVIDGDAVRSSIPEGTFVAEDLWDLLLALGLVGPDDSRVDAEQARIDNVRGACCPVAIIGTDDPVFTEVVVVHELTHGLDAELAAAGGRGEPIDTWVALSEGNAHRIAFEYADLLRGQGADLPPPPALFPPGGDPRLPVAVQRILEFPYDEGRRFAIGLAARGGEEAVVDAFGNPPVSSEQVMNVDAFLDGDDPSSVPVPDAPSAASIRREGPLGAFLLSLVLEPAVGHDRAVELALTWDGDSSVVYELDDRFCVVAEHRFDDAASAAAVADAMTAGGFITTVRDRIVLSDRCV